nr:hypothetical protein BaRGS_007052 [Batillaria attramentaria]
MGQKNYQLALDMIHGVRESWPGALGREQRESTRHVVPGTVYMTLDYNLELFRIAYNADHRPKLFLNDYNVVANGASTGLTAAGRRVFDLLENQWMTDETHVLSQSGNQFTVRGFHGNYEVHVIYQGHEKTNLKQTFTLGKGAHTVNINVH